MTGKLKNIFMIQRKCGARASNKFAMSGRTLDAGLYPLATEEWMVVHVGRIMLLGR